jgi:hypothetical protein
VEKEEDQDVMELQEVLEEVLVMQIVVVDFVLLVVQELKQVHQQ